MYQLNTQADTFGYEQVISTFDNICISYMFIARSGNVTAHALDHKALILTPQL